MYKRYAKFKFWFQKCINSNKNIRYTTLGIYAIPNNKQYMNIPTDLGYIYDTQISVAQYLRLVENTQLFSILNTCVSWMSKILVFLECRKYPCVFVCRKYSCVFSVEKNSYLLVSLHAHILWRFEGNLSFFKWAVHLLSVDC